MAAEKPRIVFSMNRPAHGATSLPDALLAAAVDRVWHGASRAAVPDAMTMNCTGAPNRRATPPAAFTVGDAPDLRLYVDRYSAVFSW